LTQDEFLTGRIQSELASLPGLTTRKMFGGVGFLLQGNMACGVHKGSLIVRVGPEKYQACLAQPHVRPFDMTGRPMAGWIMVDPPGYKDDEALRSWIWQGVEFTRSLPPK